MFDEEGLCFGVEFPHRIGTVNNRRELMSPILFVFAFDAGINLVFGFDFLVALSKTLLKFALVPLFCGFEPRLYVSDCFWEPLFPFTFEIDWGPEVWLPKSGGNWARGS